MAVGQKGLAVSDLQAAVSNYSAMCEELAGSGIKSRRCPKCDGLGFKPMTPEEGEMWDRQLAAQNDPAARANLRKKRHESTLCKLCKGGGHLTTESKLQATPCDLCEGVPGRSCKRCFGAGRVFLGFMDSFFTTVRCGRCKGSGEVVDETVEDVCQLCRGASYTIPCTVRSTGSSKSGKLPPGHGRGAESGDAGASKPKSADTVVWADEIEIAELGMLSPKLAGVAAINPTHAVVLERYFGAEGNRWQKHHWGRIFALWDLTADGVIIVKEALARPDTERRDASHKLRHGTGHLMKPLDVIAVERAEEARAKVPNLALKARIEAADGQAIQLFEAAKKTLAEVAAA